MEQKSRPVLLPLRAGSGPAYIEALGRQGAGLIDDGHLPVELFRQPGRQLQAVRGQQRAVVVVEQARRGRGLRDRAVIRAQQEKYFTVLMSQAGHFSGIDPVQRHGDAPHVILGEHQGKQPGELVQFHGGLPQDLCALLQRGAQDVPELAVFLRQRGLSPVPQRPGALLQPRGQADRLQKTVKGNRLPPSRLAPVSPQLLQGGRDLPPQGVQPLQQGPVPLGKGQAVALGVVRPVPRPCPGAPLQVPLEHIVLQQVHVLRRHFGQAGLQIPEDVVVPVAARRRIQGGGQQGHHRLLEDIAHAAEKNRHPIPGKHRLHQRVKALHAAGAHGQIPKTVALLPHQAEDLRRRPLHLGIRGVRGKTDDGFFRRPGVGGRTACKQLLLEVDKWFYFPIQPNRQHLALPGDPHLFCQAEQLSRGPPGGRKDPRAALVLLQMVAGKSHGHATRLAQQRAEHLPLLGRKVGKAVHIKLPPSGPGAPLQHRGQTGQAVPWVGPLPGRQRLIGSVDQRQV